MKILQMTHQGDVGGSTNSITCWVISSARSPRGANTPMRKGSIWLCTPKPLSTEKLMANRGTSESSVV